MSVVHFGPQTKRARLADDDGDYVVIPPRPRSSPLMQVNDLYNTRGYDDAAVTLKRHVEGTMRGEDRVKVKLTGYQKVDSNGATVRAEGDVMASTVAAYPAGLHVTLILHGDGTTELNSMFSNAPSESFTRLKFKVKKERHVSTTRERDAYLGGHSEDIVVVRLP